MPKDARPSSSSAAWWCSLCRPVAGGPPGRAGSASASATGISFGRWTPGDNIGIGCRASGVLGIELDRGAGTEGIATFAALCAAHGQPWPNTLTVRIPHGLHLYFRPPAGRTITSTSGGRGGLEPGIDTRGPGHRTSGYLIGPGFDRGQQALRHRARHGDPGVAR